MERRNVMKKVAMLLLFASLGARAWASNCVVIDDFTSGHVRLPLRTPNTSMNDAQAGAMLGGARGTAFLIGANPFMQPAEIDIDKPKNTGVPLVMTSGLRTGFRLDMEYGVDTNFMTKPLNYFPSGCDRFRVTFDSASQVLNFNIVVWYNPDFGHHAQDGINLDPAPYTSPFCVDFLFSNFAPGVPNDTPDFGSKGILLMDFIFQTGSAIGGNEFAITRIETMDPVTAANSPCAIVAPPLGS
jgi:hypothetical protein